MHKKHKYDVNVINPNITCLLTNWPHKRIKALRHGRLVEAKSLFYSRRHLRWAIEMTLRAFLTPWQNSCDYNHLQQIMEKKWQLSQRVLDRLHGSKLFDKSFFVGVEAQRKMYRQFSLFQMRLIEKIDKATKRDREHPLVQRVQAAIDRNNPLRPTEGCSGTYFLCDEIDPNEDVIYRNLQKKEILGVFKPFDEEIGGPNNPHSRQLQGTLGINANHLGIRVGENVHREVATSYLDQALGFNIVPTTCYASFSHRYFFGNDEWIYRDRVKNKRGSFQEYRRGYKTAQPPFYQDLKEVPSDALHKLFILDLLIGNTDRHSSNLLVSRDKVVAIDNGRAWGDRHTSPRIFYKSLFPQMRTPFSKELADKIMTLAIDPLLGRIKRRCFLEDKVLQCIRERHQVIAEAMRQNCLPYELAQIFHLKYMACYPEIRGSLEEKAQKIISLFKQCALRKVQVTNSIIIRAYIRQICYLDNNEKIDPEYYYQLRRANLDGYLYGVGTGNIFTCLDAFGDEGPKGLIIVDWDSHQILVAHLLKEGFKRAETWAEFVKLLGHKKGWRRMASYAKQELDESARKQISHSFYPCFKLLKEAEKDSMVILNKPQFNDWAFLKKHYNTLRKLALSNRWHAFFGNCLDPKYRQFLQEQEDFNSTKSLFYISNVLDHQRQTLIETYGYDPHAPHNFINYVNRSLLYPWKDLPLAWVDATREKLYFLRYHKTLPHYELPDFYKLF